MRLHHPAADSWWLITCPWAGSTGTSDGRSHPDAKHEEIQKDVSPTVRLKCFFCPGVLCFETSYIQYIPPISVSWVKIKAPPRTLSCHTYSLYFLVIFLRPRCSFFHSLLANLQIALLRNWHELTMAFTRKRNSSILQVLHKGQLHCDFRATPRALWKKHLLRHFFGSLKFLVCKRFSFRDVTFAHQEMHTHMAEPFWQMLDWSAENGFPQ